MPDDQSCPLCKAKATLIEHLSHGWEFCNCCGRAFLRGANGEALHMTETQKGNPLPPALAAYLASS